MSIWTEKERAAWRPREKQPVLDWARKHVRLTSEMGCQPGPYDPEATPWVELIFAAWEDRRVEGIVMVCAAQLGKTLMTQVLVCWTIDQDPSNILIFLDTDTNARHHCLHRIQPMIDAVPALVKKVDPPRKRSANKIAFDGGVLTTGGAGSPSLVASKSAPRVIRDETGKWPTRMGDEAGSLELAAERVKGQYFSTIMDVSTPVMAGDSILKRFELSNMTAVHVPCPRCGGYQKLIWRQVKWGHDEGGKSQSPAEARKTAYYECVHCGGKILDREKRWMLGYWRGVRFDPPDELGVGEEKKRRREEVKKVKKGEGQWSVRLPDGREMWYRMEREGKRGRGEEEPETDSIVGLHVNRLYSVWEPWGTMVFEWLNCGEDLSKLQTFINSGLALPFRQRSLRADEHKWQGHIWARYKALEVPEEYEFITAGADVQLKSVYYSVWAWRADGASHLIEYGELAGVEQLEAVVGMLYEKRVPRQDAKKQRDKEEIIRLGVGALFVDSRYRSAEVEDFCKAFGNAFPCKGSTSPLPAAGGPVTMGTVRTDERGKRQRDPKKWRRYVNVHTGTFKEELFNGMDADFDFDGSVPAGRAISFHAETGMDFIKQLAAEERVESRDKRGMTVHYWVVRHKQNHYLDTRVYAAAAFRYFSGGWIAERKRKKQKRRVGRWR